MLIAASVRIVYDCPAPTPMLLLLDIHPERRPDVQGDYATRFDRDVGALGYLDGFGNACTRIVAPPGLTTMTSSFVVEDPGHPDPAPPDVPQHPLETLPTEVLVYLLGSRYCDTDRLSDVAWGLFGSPMTGAARVQAICDYVHGRLAYSDEHAGPTRTAWAANHARQGVCRDFAHLAIALCRCMNIPARYCTGYLPDIAPPPPGAPPPGAPPPGAPPTDAPMDFSAWFEAFLDNRWHTFDARHNAPRIGRILMARGRDATDVALCTTFGPCTLTAFKVTAAEVAP